jgi:uncharacterized protein involved in exopolysaccharide biosynthesis
MRPERKPAGTEPRPRPDLEAEREVDFGRYVGMILARWWLVLAAIAVGCLLGYVFSRGGGDSWEATAIVYLGQTISPGGSSTLTDIADDPAAVSAIARSRVLAEEVGDQVGLSPGELRRGVSSRSVSAGRRNDPAPPLVEISVRGEDPEKVERAANLLAEAVITRVSAGIDQKIDGLRELVSQQSGQVGSIEARLDELQAAVEDRGLSTTERLVLLNLVTLAEQRYTELLSERVQTQQLLSLTQNVERGRVVTEARAAEVAARSQRSSIVVGGLIGLLAGIALALLWRPLVERRPART